MSDIPDDIMKAAHGLVAEMMKEPILAMAPFIARALLSERERSRKLLSQADKREREARRQALEEAAQVAEKTGSDNENDWPGETWIASHIAASIRALQSEERGC